MTDIFGLTQKTVGATFARGDTFALQVDGNTVGLAQNVSIAYSRPLQSVFSLGTSDVAMTTGRPQGQLSIARVIGALSAQANAAGAGAQPAPGASQLSLIDLLGDAFFKLTADNAGGTLTVKPLAGKGLGANAAGNNNFGFTLTGCFVVGEQFGGSAQDVVIIESVQIQFIAMEKI